MLEVHEIDELDLAIVKVRGKITFDEVITDVIEHTKNGLFHKRSYQISDIRDTIVEMSHSEIYDFIKFLKSNQNYKRAPRVVYLANDSRPTAISYLLTQSFDESIDHCVFSTVEGALKNLGLYEYRDIITCFIEEE